MMIAYKVLTTTVAVAAVVIMAAATNVTSSNTSGQSATPRDPIPYYIVEELPVGTLIGSVPVDAGLDGRYDEHEMTLLRYRLVGQKTVESGVRVELFDIDEVTGIIRTTVQIDRDHLCAARLVCRVELQVLVRPGQRLN